MYFSSDSILSRMKIYISDPNNLSRSSINEDIYTHAKERSNME